MPGVLLTKRKGGADLAVDATLRVLGVHWGQELWWITA